MIFTQDFFGNFVSESSRVRGKPARWDWLVIATAITVPDLSLKMWFFDEACGIRKF
jgi:hypothetical protein